MLLLMLRILHFTCVFLAWNDIRTDSTVDAILAKIPDRNKNYLKNICGLPISPYFSALKMRWLKDNIKSIRRASRDKRLLFGTVDSWIIWVSLLKTIPILGINKHPLSKPSRHLSKQQLVDDTVLSRVGFEPTRLGVVTY